MPGIEEMELGTALKDLLDKSSGSGEDPKPSEDPKPIEEQITEILSKEESELTDEERTLLEKNEEVANRLLEAQEKGGQQGKEGEEEIGLLAEFMKEEGYLEEGEYEDSSEGLKKYIADRDKARDLKVITSFLESSPDVARVFNHVVVEGKPFASLIRETTKPEILEEKLIEIKPTSSDEDKETAIKQHTKIIRAGLKGKVSDTILEGMITTAVEKGETLALAKDVLKDIEASYNNEIESINKEAAARKKAEQDEANAAKENIKRLITKGEVAANVLIPESEKTEFYDFLVKPVDALTGKTKQTLIMESLTDEEDMLLDYLLFVKAKKGKIDFSALKSKSTVKKFFKNAKKANEDRSARAAGASSNREDQGNALDLLNSLGRGR